VVSLANLSDNFQKMLSDPKGQQKNLENVHQFVTTSHLFTAYSASLSQYAQKNTVYREIDFENWKNKINAELSRTIAILQKQEIKKDDFAESKLTPEDLVNELLEKRKEEITENEKYLNEIIALSGKVKKPNTTSDYPSTINTTAKRALFDNLGRNETLANELDHKILTTKKDGWRDNIQKSKAVRNAITEVLKTHGIEDDSEVHRIFDLVKNQRDY
jgi:hypothetical protein